MMQNDEVGHTWLKPDPVNYIILPDHAQMSVGG